MASPVGLRLHSSTVQHLGGSHFCAIQEGSRLFLPSGNVDAAASDQLQLQAIADHTTDAGIDEDEKSGLFCTTCAVAFDNAAEAHRQHYRTDWHRCNLNRVAKGQPPLSHHQYVKTLDSPGSGAAGSVVAKRATDSDSDSGSGSHGSEEEAAQSAEDEADQSQPEVGSPQVVFYVQPQSSGPASESQTTITAWKNALIPFLRGAAASFTTYLDAFKQMVQSAGSPVPESRKNWVVLISSGGAFAGGVFRGEECLVHKAMQRYTVRRKQGGLQSSKDNQGGNAPKSAGSTLRRYNQRRFGEDLQELLKEWAPFLTPAVCSHIFMFAPSINRSLFFFPGSPIEKGDARVQSIPTAVRNVTFQEVQRVYSVLSTVWTVTLDHAVYGGATSLQARAPALSSSTAAGVDSLLELKRPAIDPEQVARQQVEDAMVSQRRQLHDRVTAAVRSGSVPMLSAVFAEVGSVPYWYPAPLASGPLGSAGTVLCSDGPLHLACAHVDTAMMEALLSYTYSTTPGFAVQDSVKNRVRIDIDGRDETRFFRTALHVAAEAGRCDLLELLLEHHANPELRDSKKQTPYNLCKDKDSRLVFRNFASVHQDTWDWTAACVPVSDETEAERLQREQDKKAKKRQKEKERLKAKKERERIEKEEAAAEAAAELARVKKQQTQDAERKSLADAASSREKKLNSMSDRDKRAAAMEARLNAAAGKALPCSNPACGKPILSVPFERYDYKYCSMDCVQSHRVALGK